MNHHSPIEVRVVKKAPELQSKLNMLVNTRLYGMDKLTVIKLWSVVNICLLMVSFPHIARAQGPSCSALFLKDYETIPDNQVWLVLKELDLIEIKPFGNQSDVIIEAKPSRFPWRLSKTAQLIRKYQKEWNVRVHVTQESSQDRDEIRVRVEEKLNAPTDLFISLGTLKNERILEERLLELRSDMIKIKKMKDLGVQIVADRSSGIFQFSILAVPDNVKDSALQLI